MRIDNYSMNSPIRNSLTALALSALTLAASTNAWALRGDGDLRDRNAPNRANVHVDNSRNSVNVNRNVNVDVHNNDNYHPVARAAAVTATVAVTAAAVGSIARSLPTGCGPVMVAGIAYQQCGSTWYQPQMTGTQTQYVVVNAPH